MAEETKQGAGEPSMEEILASIRQIINQNDKPGEGEAAAADTAAEETEVLELTNILDEPAPPPAPAPAPAAVQPPVEEAPAPAMEDILAAMQGTAPAQPVAAAPEPQPAPVAPPAPVTGDGLISGATAQNAAAALGTLAAAAAQEKLEHSLPIGNNMRTLESMVVEAMKPLLKEWLDANLAGIVERIVQAEVEKLTKRLGG
ncbi:MAG: DUF2497 domain-containing protein [Bdellovibrionales bacterium]